MGQPKEPGRKLLPLSCRVPPDIYETICRMAARYERSVSAVTVRLLRRALDKPRAIRQA